MLVSNLNVKWIVSSILILGIWSKLIDYYVPAFFIERSSFLDLDKYLKHQMELQKGRRKLATTTKDSKQKDNRFDEENIGKAKKTGKKLRRVIAQDDSDEAIEAISASEDEAATQDTKDVKRKKKKLTMGKSPIDYNILFPKKRKRKEKVGTGTSDDPWYSYKILCYNCFLHN